MTAPPATENVVRVFVSSTFRDMHAERDHLVTVVFPELRERLEPLGLELRDVDLRWGIPQTGVDGERANPWAYCKQWIERSEPLFVSILGQRYGCKPAPADIAEEQDRRTFAGMSITEMEVRHAVLTGRLRRRSFFYFRKPKVPPAARPEVYREFVDAADEPRLDALRQEIALRSGRPVRWYDCRWSGSGFESLDAFGQAVLEDLWSGVLRDDRYVPREAWRRVLGRDPDRDPIYTDESKPVPRPVWERVVAEARPKPRDPLDAEAEQMAAFSRSLLRWFQGRHSELAALARFVEDQAPAARRVCVVKAVPGQGKSALLARFWQDARQPRSGGPPLVLAHFVGATQQSADPRLLLERLLKELDRNGIAPAQKKQEQEEPGDDLDTLAVRLAARLEKHAGEPRVVLLLDGLNQLTWGHGLSWLPRTFGPGVRVIATCIDAQSDGPERQVLAALMDRGPMVLDLRPLDAAAIDQVVREFLREHCKELEPKPLETICAMPQSGNPLYLLVMLNELRTLGGNDMNLMVPKLIAQMRQSHPDTVALFDWLLQRLEVFGPDAVRHWCSCLAAGRTGMASPELRDLLARKLGPAAGSAALRIERGLRRYLQRRGPQLDFFHGQLRQAVLRRYLAHDADRISTHQDVANYLESRWREPHRHALEELPHQRRMARDWQGLDRVLSDLAFVEAKSCAGMVNELAQDYAAAGADLPEGQGGQVPAFADFFAHARALLSEMLALAPPERASPVRQLAANWKEGSPVRTAARNLPAPPQPRLWTSIAPPPLSDAGEQSLVLAASGGPWRRVALDERGLTAIAGAQDGSLHVFDLATRSLRHRLPVHDRPVSAVGISADGRIGICADGHPQMQLYDFAHIMFTLSYETGRKHGKDDAPVPPLPGRVRVFNLLTGEPLAALEPLPDWVTGVAITPDGRLAAASCVDGSATVYDLATFRCLRRFGPPRASSLPYSPDEDPHVVESYEFKDGALKRSQPGRGERAEKEGPREPHFAPATAVALSPDGKTLVVGHGDYSGFLDTPQNCELIVWDVPSGRERRRHKLFKSIVAAIAVTRDSEWAIAVSRGHEGAYEQFRGRAPEAAAVNLQTGETVTFDCRFPPLLTCIALAEAAGRWTVGGGKGGKQGNWGCLQDWSSDGQQLLTASSDHVMLVTACATTPRGDLLLSAGLEGTLRLQRLRDRTASAPESQPGSREPAGIALSPDGRHVVTGHGDGSVSFWNGEDGGLLATTQGHMLAVSAVLLDAAGRTALTASLEDSVCLWDVPEARLRERLDLPCRAADLAPDGETVALGQASGDLLVLHPGRGGPPLRWHGHDRMVTSVRFSPDGQTLLSTSVDKTIRRWAVADGRELLRISGHKQIPFAAVLSPDQMTLAGLTKANETCYFSAEDGRLIETVSHPVTDAFFSADAAALVTVVKFFPTELEQCWVTVDQFLKPGGGYRTGVFRRGVVGVQLTADQQYLLGCSVGDARLLVLDFRTGGTVAVCPLQSSSQVVAASRVTPAGKLALAFRSGTIQIHQLRDADLTDPVVPWLRTAPVRGTGPDCLFRCAWCGTAIALHRRPETPVGLSCPGCRQGLRLVRPLLWHAR